MTEGGCEQHPHPRHPRAGLPARSRGRRSAASYSRKLQPGEVQKTKISISLILIFLAADFSTLAAQGHAGREGAERDREPRLQPRDVALPSPLLLRGGVWPKGPHSFHWDCCLGKFKNCYMKKVMLCRLDSWSAMTLANSQACVQDGGKGSNILSPALSKFRLYV